MVKLVMGVMPQNALFGLLSTIFRVLFVTCWWRHNSRQSHNDHLVSGKFVIS